MQHPYYIGSIYIIIKQHTQISVFTVSKAVYQLYQLLLYYKNQANLSDVMAFIQRQWKLSTPRQKMRWISKYTLYVTILDMANKQHINLSWGMDTNMDTLQAIKNENQTNRNKNLSKNQRNYLASMPQQQKKSAKDKKPLTLPPGVYQKKSDQEQLQKIMNSYKNKQIGYQSPMKVMQLQQKNQNKTGRTQTEQSVQKLRQLQSSLLQSPVQSFHRRDTMGSIIQQDKLLHPEIQLSQSRVSRRSSSGNRKNQSKVVLGDGIYNQFAVKSDKKKDYHEMLMEMYQYEEKRNSRKISQIAL